MDSNDSHELDLPLMSNIGDICVRHFMLDLQCNFDHKTLSGFITLFCEPRKREIVSSENEQQNTHSKAVKKKEPIADSDCFNESRQFSVTSFNISNSEDCQEARVDNMCHAGTQSDKHRGLAYDTSEHSYAEHAMEESKLKVRNESEASKTSEINYGPQTLEYDTESICNSSSHVAGNSVDNITVKSDRSNAVNSTTTTTAAPVMVLDSWDLEVEMVHELCIPSGKLTDTFIGNDINKSVEKLGLYEMSTSVQTQTLKYTNEKKCLKIWKDGLADWSEFPRVIQICYQTHPHGQSLKWTQDQDGRSCVYTHGHWINNRSLFPSQDVPVAMATWTAYIHAPIGTLVLMSGDRNPIVSAIREGYKTYHYYTNMEMPSSTLALAIGCWEQTDLVGHKEAVQIMETDRSILPCRLISPRKHLETAKTLLCEYMPRCMEAACWLLGPHPFSRLDILIVPSNFASLGMASPCLMFLSQSVLSTDGGMLVRVAHELSHSWFGLLIGPRDWHEEWLSEGFCTYTEGIIHARSMQWSEEETRHYVQLQDFLKYRTLQAEIGNIHSDLQTLRPGEQCVSDQSLTYVKNGMNPEKGFMQLHYLKGYFLLRFLEHEVGRERFRAFLQSAVRRFHHQLITSNDILILFMENLSSDHHGRGAVASFTYYRLQQFGKYWEGVYTSRSSKVNSATVRDWLEKPGIPSELKRPELTEIPTATIVIALVEEVKKLQLSYTKLHWRKRQKMDFQTALPIPKFNNDQLILFLELLLEENKIHADILSSLGQTLNLDARNPDVLHRWCELVVKHKVEESYQEVNSFLIDHQAMGVYLFGELMVTRDSVQRKLVLSTFDCIKDEMEEGIRRTVKSMLFGE